MDLVEVLETIRREFATAHLAMQAGNDGMVRVCARRAAGTAIVHWRKSHPLPGSGTNAVTRLQSLAEDAAIPEGVRSAAKRLCAKTGADHLPTTPANALEDCRLIIRHLLGESI